jgi:hypothetical protein
MGDLVATVIGEHLRRRSLKAQEYETICDAAG